MGRDLRQLQEKIKTFNQERDWEQYHNAKDLLIALMSEVGELADCYRWLSEEEIRSLHADAEKRQAVEEEIADILINLLIIADKAGVDVHDAVEQKLEKNRKKYPAEQYRSKHSNKFVKGI